MSAVPGWLTGLTRSGKSICELTLSGSFPIFGSVTSSVTLILFGISITIVVVECFSSTRAGGEKVRDRLSVIDILLVLLQYSEYFSLPTAGTLNPEAAPDPARAAVLAAPVFLIMRRWFFRVNLADGAG
jgi:hypothetical protein